MVLTGAPLPELSLFRFVLRAEEPQRLSRFIPTAVHGALGDALRSAVCAYPARPACEGCLLVGRCTYPALFETPGLADPILEARGIRSSAPRPLALAAEPGWLDDAVERHLESGDQVALRLTLIGTARSARATIEAALERAADCGLGIRPGGGTPRRRSADSRPRMRLTELEELPGPDSRLLSREGIDFDLVTPLRLKVDGSISGYPAPVDVVRALARRANTLSRLGGADEPVDEEAAVASAATILSEKVSVRRVPIRRWSSRQRKRLDLPGLMGTLRWSGAALGPLSSLLRWGEGAQVGKGTSMGFGRYRIEESAAMHFLGSSPVGPGVP